MMFHITLKLFISHAMGNFVGGVCPGLHAVLLNNFETLMNFNTLFLKEFVSILYF